MAGEFDFIDWLRGQQAASELVAVPAGDDLAVLNWPAEELLVVGVDQVLDGVHFDSKVHSPGAIGVKVMNRNLSDCAAMACLPAAAVVSAALPRGVGLEYAKQLYLGMKEAGSAFGCAIVGGDTGTWDGKLALSVTIMGRSAGIKPVTRGGAKAGDGIYVTGRLGGSIYGRHMTFTPRVREARELATRYRITAMIDLSDGLSRDLGHICRQSGVGAVVSAGRLPVHEDVKANEYGYEHALSDGEDYELLFTSPDRVEDPLVTQVGTITAEQGVWLQRAGDRQRLAAGGWEHGL
jgi:thiamine-monophosphate kinase